MRNTFRKRKQKSHKLVAEADHRVRINLISSAFKSSASAILNTIGPKLTKLQHPARLNFQMAFISDLCAALKGPVHVPPHTCKEGSIGLMVLRSGCENRNATKIAYSCNLRAQMNREGVLKNLLPVRFLFY